MKKVLQWLNPDAVSWGEEDGIAFVRVPMVGTHPAQPDLRRRFPDDTDWQFAQTPNDKFYHGTTMRFFPRICSALRLVRGDRSIGGRFGVNLTRSIEVALQYTLASWGLRFVFECQAFLSKSAGRAENVVCKEYWTELKAIRLILNYTPKQCLVRPTAYLAPLPMVCPIPTSLSFIEWEAPLPEDFLMRIYCR